MKNSLTLAAFATTLVLASQAHAKQVLHRVQETGETYADIADHYYGKRYLERHLRLFNRRPEPLRKGTTIIIPTYTVVPVKRGQSLAEFAAAHLNDQRRAAYLAELHRLRGREKTNPRPSKRLRVVQSLKHVVRRGETLSSIANLYYRDSSGRRQKLIALYNGIEGKRLRSGRPLRIPLDTPQFSRSVVARRSRRPFTPGAVAAAPPPPKSPPKAMPPRSTKRTKKSDDRERRKELVAALELAERLYGNGEYDQCQESASAALTDPPEGAFRTKTDLFKLLAFSQIAHGEYGEAKHTFRKLLALDPKYELDLYTTSPKILDIFEAVAMR